MCVCVCVCVCVYVCACVFSYITFCSLFLLDQTMDDVEAILAEIESDEEGELNLDGLVNLEDILKEEDDDDELGMYACL